MIPEVLPRNSLAERSPKEGKVSYHRRVNISGASLPSGKVNAIRAALKAGVRLSAINSEYRNRTSCRLWQSRDRSGEAGRAGSGADRRVKAISGRLTLK
jgi:hypothetical protein